MMTAVEIVQALGEPFRACELELRTQPFTALYVDARAMVARLNRILPGDWSFSLVGGTSADEKNNVSRLGCLTIHYPNGPREFYSVGTETPDQGRGEPKSEKGADSDTFKRCCFRAGIGAYLYEFGKEEIKTPNLTERQVETAARLAGYNGPIRPEHFGPINRNRAIGDAPTGGDRAPATRQAPPASRPVQSANSANGAPLAESEALTAAKIEWSAFRLAHGWGESGSGTPPELKNFLLACGFKGGLKTLQDYQVAIDALRDDKGSIGRDPDRVLEEGGELESETNIDLLTGEIGPAEDARSAQAIAAMKG